MSEKVYVDALSEGDLVQSTFLVLDKAIRPSRTGELYLRLTLADRSGRIEGRAWTDPEALGARLEVDDFVALRGEVTRYGDALQLDVADLDRLADDAVDLADYFPTSRWETATLWAQLRDLLSEHVESEQIRAFLDALFEDEETARQFRTAPAAMSNHHAYLGGLIEHVLSMCGVALRLAEHYDAYYPGLINRDLLLAGVVLHDFAKVWELSYRRAFDYSTQGRLVGHIPMGAEHVGRVAARAKSPISDDLQMHLKHLVLSHHGELEYGSPIKPMTPEALLLHQIDMIDSRMNMLSAERGETTSAAAPESWTDFRRRLGGRILFRGANSAGWEVETPTTAQDLIGPGIARGPSPNTGQNLNLFGDEP